MLSKDLKARVQRILWKRKRDGKEKKDLGFKSKGHRGHHRKAGPQMGQRRQRHLGRALKAVEYVLEGDGEINAEDTYPAYHPHPHQAEQSNPVGADTDELASALLRGDFQTKTFGAAVHEELDPSEIEALAQKLLQKVRHRQDQFDSFFEISQEYHPSRAMDRILRLGCDALDATSVRLVPRQQHEANISDAKITADDVVFRIVSTREEEYISQSTIEDSIVVSTLESLVPDPEEELRRKFFEQVTSFIGTSVLGKCGAVIGVLYATNKRDFTGFDSFDVATIEVLANNLAEIIKRPKLSTASQTKVGERAFKLMENEVEVASVRNALLRQGSIEAVIACANIEGKRLCRSDHFALLVVGSGDGMFTVQGNDADASNVGEYQGGGGDGLQGEQTGRRRRKRAIIGLKGKQGVGLERIKVASRLGLHSVFMNRQEKVEENDVVVVTDTRGDRRFSPDLDATLGCSNTYTVMGAPVVSPTTGEVIAVARASRSLSMPISMIIASQLKNSPRFSMATTALKPPIWFAQLEGKSEFGDVEKRNLLRLCAELGPIVEGATSRLDKTLELIRREQELRDEIINEIALRQKMLEIIEIAKRFSCCSSAVDLYSVIKSSVCDVLNASSCEIGVVDAKGELVMFVEGQGIGGIGTAKSVGKSSLVFVSAIPSCTDVRFTRLRSITRLEGR